MWSSDAEGRRHKKKEWQPTHLTYILSENDITEAWIPTEMRAGIKFVATSTNGTVVRCNM